jgi:hypothetical protein
MQRVSLASPDVASRGRQAPPGMVDIQPGRGAGHLVRTVGRRTWLEDRLAILCLVAVLGADLALIRVGLDAIDEGYFVEQATRVLRGELPYRDFDSLYTPGLLYVHAVLFSLFGETHVLLPRAVGLVARALLAGGLYVICRPMARPVFAVLPGLYVLVGLDRVPATWEPHPGWPSAALTVLAAWGFTQLPRLSNGQRRHWLIAIGAVTGLVFAFKQNAGAFLVLALVAFTAWQGVDHRETSVTRSLRMIQLLLLLAVLLAAAWLIHPAATGVVAVYFLVPLAAAGVAAIGPVSVSADGWRPVAWLQAVGLLGLGSALVTLPWVVVLAVALDGRLDLLQGFVGAVDHALPWQPLTGPGGGAWASLLGVAVAAMLAIRLRHQVLLLCAAVALVVVFAASGVLLTAEPGEAVLLTAVMAPGRTAIGLAVMLPVLCILAGAWQSLRSPPTLATWRLRWLTVAGALTFLTQYPRIDDAHLAWSAGLPLATGTVVLSQLHAKLANRWGLGHMGRALLCAVLIAVPVATILPGLADRSQGFANVAVAGRLAPRLESVTMEMSLPAIEGLIVTNEQAATLLAAVRFVRANTAPGEPIFIYPSSPLVYVAADRPNPTRFAHLYPGAASAEEVQGVIAALSQIPVRIVVVSGAELAFWGPPAGNQPLEAYLAQSYREVARFGSYRVLTRS